MAREDVFSVLDVGSTRVAALIGKYTFPGQVIILGAGVCPVTGIRRGVLVEQEAVVQSIRQAVAQAEGIAGFKIHGVYVGFDSPEIALSVQRASIGVAEKEINAVDVQRLLNSAENQARNQDCKIIHNLPRRFVVDGYQVVSDPVGKVATSLEVETVCIVLPKTSCDGLVTAVRRAGLEVTGLAWNSLVAGDLLLQEREKELGACYIDLGGGTSKVVFFEGAAVQSGAVIPIGGEYITSDLAVGLRTPFVEAARVQKEYGRVLAALAPENEYIEVKSIGGQGSHDVSLKLVASIIEPRVQEIFAYLRQALLDTGYQSSLAGGIVINGGVTHIAGLTELLAEEFQLPVRLGTAPDWPGLPENFTDPSFAGAWGLLHYCGQNSADDLEEELNQVVNGFFGRFKNWLHNSLSKNL